MADDAATFTELWEIDPETGTRTLVARFERALHTDEAVDLAVAHSLDELGDLTVDDLFPPAA